MDQSRVKQHLKRKKQRRKRLMSAGLLSAALLGVLGCAAIWFGSGRDSSNTLQTAPTASPGSSTAASSGSGAAVGKTPAVKATPSAEAGSSSGKGTPPAGSAHAGVGLSPGVSRAPASSSGANTSNTMQPVKDEPQVSMAFVGDVIFASTVETALKKNGYDFPFRNLQKELSEPDITVANLETPITVRGEEQVKQYAYRSSPEALPAFKKAGFDVVGLANNHIMDYGVQGLLDTLDHLDKADILRTGAGRNLKEAYTPAVVERNGIKTAFLSFSHVVPDNSWKAGANKPGTTQLYDKTQAVKTIEETRKNADLVVVMAHWGVERDGKPQAVHREMAKAFIDAGADLVIGSHPHVLQGLEAYKGKWIAYSLGNFLFTTNNHEPTWETAILNASCGKSGGCSVSLVPVSNKFADLARMDEEAGKKLFKRLTSVSYGVLIDEKGQAKLKEGS